MRLRSIALALVGLTLVTASVGVAVGALTGRRLYATAAAAGVAVLGYAINAVANQAPDLDWLHRLSPYDWAFGGLPLADGPDPGALLALYGIAAALIAVGAIALGRRDVSP